MAKKKPQKHNRNNILRIIGGQWRSRKLSFPDAPGLRPTPDRIRETLFNWLQADIHGANCLDLFAGSGALGLEALSRGADTVNFVEKNKAAAQQLITNLKLLDTKAAVYQLDALDYLAGVPLTQKSGGGAKHIIFLDPPYHKGLIDKSLLLLQEKNLINQDTLIYLEHESEESYDWNNYSLNSLKETTAGQVKCFLLNQKL